MQRKAATNQHDRRSMLQSPYSMQPQPPASTSFLQANSLNMAMPLGVNMTMNDMETSIRAFPSLQPQPPQHPHLLPSANGGVDGPSASFWRSAAMENPYKNNGLDLELNDFLSGGGRDGGPSAAGTTSASSNGPGVDGVDVNMNESPFQLSSSFGGLGSLTVANSGPLSTSAASSGSFASSAVAPLHAGLLSRGMNASSMSVTSPGSDATGNTPSSSASASRPAVPVAAATGAPDANDYSRYVDSTDEPDLSQHKIEQKNEKCQYHNCPNRARVSQAYGKFCNRHVIVAPCGFPGCRDKARINSSMCDKHLAEGKDALHRILASRAQNVPVCRTFGCFKNDQGRGYCRGHEKLLMATGRLPKHINKRRLNSAYTMCSYPNCNKHSQRNHLCRTHGNLILKQAEELAKQSSSESFEDILARLQKEVRRCTHPTCTKNSQRDRLCTMHYYEKQNGLREGGAKDSDHPPSSTDGNESDMDVACSFEGCNMQAYSQGLCKYHVGASTPGSTTSQGNESATRADHASRSHQICAIAGCGNHAPYASGLCAHHGNKTNQAMQITRLGAPPPTSTNRATACQVNSCSAFAVPGSNVCANHRRAFGNADIRPSLENNANGFYGGGAQTGGAFMGGDSTLAMPGNDQRYGSMSGGATTRMANLNVGSNNASMAESDARQALCDLNNQKAGSTASGSSTCSNPICTRESFGREFCDSCQNIFSPLVVSVGDVGSNNSYGFQLSSGEQGNQSLEPESDGEQGNQSWGEGGSQAKTTTLKTRELCRVKDCSASLSRGGLCDAHFQAFQSGTLSVDQISFHSRQIVEEHERSIAAENKQATSPKVKKYFCKMDGCDKQAQKRGLCKRHFRMQETENANKDAGMSSSDNQVEDQLNQGVRGCYFPGCIETVNSLTTLCPSHTKATYCWQAGCENIVESAQFCDYHAYRRECAFDGCAFSAGRDSSGCPHHNMERRCNHEYCDKFAATNADRCRQHFQNCAHQPCVLCKIHGLGRQSFPQRSDGKAAPMASQGNPVAW
ncbi:hypothetical protein Poli38472_000674 [Pythium oligandrum]|uniref:WRKY19-like zinc finger domain-containing protein n=1 Tax=Pythium oligandrum TaxID=41045 RepID=A0A8K1FIC3_PYTOL|nr:hypothetical protein Poli38472_000674 [Pythium oligandrum]|eukprot:TMW60632.1 hypothetical protein Poli38472_000674 [Pythium oligandrum]